MCSQKKLYGIHLTKFLFYLKINLFNPHLIKGRINHKFIIIWHTQMKVLYNTTEQNERFDLDERTVKG